MAGYKHCLAAQVLIQLKKFASARKRMKAAAGSASQQGADSGAPGGRPGLQVSEH